MLLFQFAFCFTFFYAKELFKLFIMHHPKPCCIIEIILIEVNGAILFDICQIFFYKLYKTPCFFCIGIAVRSQPH